MRRNKFSSRAILLLLLAILVFPVLVVMGVRGTSQDLNQHYAILELIQESQKLNSEIDQSVLKAGSFTLDDYDELAKQVEKMLAACGELENLSVQKFTSSDPRVKSSILKACDLTRRKTEAVERFKSENSILKNSFHYLPGLVAALDKTEYWRNSSSLMAEVSRFALTRDDESEARIRESVKNLTHMTKTGRNNLVVKNLMSHTEIILRAASNRREVEAEILSNQVKEAFGDVRKSYVQWHGVAERRANRYHEGLFLFCSILAAGLILFLMKIRSLGLQLQSANAELEERVALRTAELSAALEKVEESQQFLLQSTKMSALGEMAGGIAHEINTPLAAISMTAEFLEEMARENNQPSMVKGLESITSIVEKVSRIILGLRRFSRDSSQDPSSKAYVKDILADTLTLCTEKFRTKKIRLEIRDLTEEIPVNCVAEQISQVILNLFHNSVDAIAELPSESLWILVEVIPTDQSVEISVTDGGHGIPENVQAKLMQPFFTTKPVGKGTGLGLSLSKGIVERQRGTFVYDKTSKNTKFTVTLPRYFELKIAG